MDSTKLYVNSWRKTLDQFNKQMPLKFEKGRERKTGVIFKHNYVNCKQLAEQKDYLNLKIPSLTK